MYIVTARTNSSDHFSFAAALANLESLYDYLYIIDKSDYVLEFKVTFEDTLVTNEFCGWGKFDKWFTSFFSK
jgi:hypothetical protein